MLLASTAFSKIIIESNFPLRNSNLEEFTRDEDLPLLLWTLQNLKDVKDIKITLRGKDTVIMIERYPIAKRIKVTGNWFVSDSEIKNLLGVREGEPIIEFDPSIAVENLRRFYAERGFLDAVIDIELKDLGKGYKEVIIEVKEGDLYYLGYPFFEGLRSVTFKRALEESGLRVGDIFKESDAKHAQERISEFLRRVGFYESIVYFQRVEKRNLKRPFGRVIFPLERPSFKGFLSSILRGISNLLNHPIATIKALSGRGKIAIPHYTIIEGRRFRVSFEGNNFLSDAELRDLIFEKASGIDFFFLEISRERIGEYYRTKGFFEVNVDYLFAEGEIIFRIKEGPRYRIEVKGKANIELPEFYDRQEITEAVQSLKERLKKEGYLYADVSLEEQVMEAENKVQINVRVSKGKRVILKGIIYRGEDPEISSIFSKLGAGVPTVLDEKILEELNRELRRYFRAQGYLEGDFSVDVYVEETPNSIELSYAYDVKKGPRYRYGKLVVYGNKKTKAKEIDYITIKQDYYSSIAEEETMWNLIQSEIFTGARIEAYIDRENKLVHRLIEVREDKRGVIEAGVGYNTEEKFKVDAGLKLKNLFGLGIISSFSISYSERYRIYEARLSDNFFFTWKHFVDTALFRRFEFHESFDLDSTGYSATLGYRPWRWYTMSVFYSGTENRVEGYGSGIFRLRRYGIFFAREKRDDMLNPRNMSHVGLRYTRAEGDRNYSKIEVNTFFLREILSWFSINTRLAGGSVEKEAPIFDRFFLGGLRDMRGYNFESIGYPFGGSVYYFGRLETMFRIYGPLWSAFYSEVGNVGDNFSEAQKSPKFDVGTAIGVSSPAGFIRLDVARALTPLDVPVPSVRVYLSIGYIY